MAHGKARIWIDDASLEFVARKDDGPEVTAAREAIQKQYDRMDEAGNAGRWDEILAVALPDARSGSAVMRIPIAQQIEQMKKMAASGARLTGKTEVVAVTLAGGEATVRIRGVTTMTKGGIPRRYEGTNRDVWVLRDGAWRLKDSTIVSGREVIAELDEAAAKRVAAAIAAKAVPLRTAEAGGLATISRRLERRWAARDWWRSARPRTATREIFQMKHRMLEHLVKEKGFTVFAIEANWPESQTADRYIKTGEGDPRQL